jgi:hypothetical protein
MRHLVPITLLFSIAGCYLEHGLDPRGDGGGGRAPVDAGRARDAGRTPIPEPSVDAGLPGSDECPLVRAISACPDPGVALAGQRFELPLRMLDCGCCERTECRVEVANIDGAPTLSIETRMCGGGDCACFACERIDAACSIPALEEGDWNVVINDVPAFTLPVRAAPPWPESAWCVQHADPAECTTAPYPLSSVTTPWRPDTVCIENMGLGDRQVRAVTECSSCTAQGPFSVRVEPRLTDDLPSGGEIYLEPTHIALGECALDCPSICIPLERTARLPPLEPGGFYRVWLPDRSVGLQFFESDPFPACSGREE